MNEMTLSEYLRHCAKSEYKDFMNSLHDLEGRDPEGEVKEEVIERIAKKNVYEIDILPTERIFLVWRNSFWQKSNAIDNALEYKSIGYILTDEALYFSVPDSKFSVPDSKKWTRIAYSKIKNVEARESEGMLDVVLEDQSTITIIGLERGPLQHIEGFLLRAHRIWARENVVGVEGADVVDVEGADVVDDGETLFTLTIDYTYGKRIRKNQDSYLQVYEVQCLSYPVISEEQRDAFLNTKYKDLREVEEDIAQIKSNLKDLFGYEVEISFVKKEEEERYDADEAIDFKPLYGKTHINLYVDIGSTNTKCFVKKCDATGRYERFEMGNHEVTPTERFCSERGFNYDKRLAYTSSGNDFFYMLAKAVKRLICAVEKDHQAHVVDVMWSFPKLVNESKTPLKTPNDFKCLSQKVTQHLKEEYGLLRGEFTLVEEGEALRAMFENQIRTVLESVKEESKKTKAAQAKQEAEEATRVKNAKKWNEEHCWLTKLLKKNPYGTPYHAVISTPEELWKAFQLTGASLESKYQLVLLDAGGSTLDFSILDVNDKKPGSAVVKCGGSLKAGGQDLIKVVQKQEETWTQDDIFEKFSQVTGNVECRDKCMNYTKSVYEKPLAEICKKVSVEQPKCVICSGLAMKNVFLSKLVRETFGLKNEQFLFYSPNVVDGIKDISNLPKNLKDFIEIVRGKEGRIATPAFDVSGGLYFKHQELFK